ncbi:putative glycosyltransferase EpsD [Rubripirellula reticaptiva]|uniref:Putative glycosyltransferase EpsD n=2 Tax=Rubripirellula reticaptiva TaxID=2528013 RepID=A0A5C6F6I9_9BACT|nr:putative glycosyltransferase EpsD [Rubripirellula reticaptiva]
MIIGGAQENTLLNCLDLVRDYGDDVLLITGPSVGPEGDLLSQGRAGDLPVRILPNLLRSIHPSRDWAASRSIRQAIREFKPDVVHTHSAKGGMLGRYVAWDEQVPAVIHSVHGAPFHPYQSAVAREFFRRCEKWAAKHCHRMISVADAMTDLMVKANVAPREKFQTIYSGMDVEPFVHANDHRDAVRQKWGFENHHVVIGKIARLFHLKGHDDLVTAAAEVVGQNANVRFLLVGDGILRPSLKKRIDELGLTHHFVFTGLVPPTEVPSLIGAMDVLVHTSYREGLARALPQALIAGKPIVSYDVDGAREVTIDDLTGFLIPAQDTGQLARSLVQLAGDEPMRRRMGREGQSRFTDQFRHQTMTKEIRHLYGEVLASKSPRPV